MTAKQHTNATHTATIEGVIFDLDGVIISTDNYHYLAWKQLADREGIYFDRTINDRLRGVSRMESLTILLERAERTYAAAARAEMAEYKNRIYRQSLTELTPDSIFPGVLDFLAFLDSRQIKVAIGSSSKNSKFILDRIGLLDTFQGAISDGTNIERSKPDPEVFLKAAEMIKLRPDVCLVIEDAEAGIEAAVRGGMRVLGVGPMKAHPKADYGAESIQQIDRAIFDQDRSSRRGA